jgi:hypothetical protein
MASNSSPGPVEQGQTGRTEGTVHAEGDLGDPGARAIGET